jgi:hypothetical protein
LRQQILARSALYYSLSDRIRVLFMTISHGADGTGQLHTGLLLHDMRGFVCRGAQRGKGAESDTVSAGIGLGVHALRRGCCLGPDMGLYIRQVLATPKRLLDRVPIGQGSGVCGKAILGKTMHIPWPFFFANGRLAEILCVRLGRAKRGTESSDSTFTSRLAVQGASLAGARLAHSSGNSVLPADALPPQDTASSGRRSLDRRSRFCRHRAEISHSFSPMPR